MQTTNKRHKELRSLRELKEDLHQKTSKVIEDKLFQKGTLMMTREEALEFGIYVILNAFSYSHPKERFPTYQTTSELLKNVRERISLTKSLETYRYYNQYENT